MDRKKRKELSRKREVKKKHNIARSKTSPKHIKKNLGNGEQIVVENPYTYI